MKTLQEMRELHTNGELQLLTLDAAKRLIGKKISTIYFGYNEQDGIDCFIVGSIVSEYDIAKRQEVEGYKNRTEYWQSYMKPSQLQETKNTYQIITNTGRNTYITCHLNILYFGENVFSCSDIDRLVFFTEEE